MKFQFIKFEEAMLSEKIQLFSDLVREAALNLKVAIPRIEFWDGFCPTAKPGEDAHIHLDSRTICISKARLKNMSKDDIRETAIHEVSHLVVPNHNNYFWNTLAETRRDIWRPPFGVVINGDER